MSERMRRVNEAVRAVIADAVSDLKDPRIGMVTVTGVSVTPDRVLIVPGGKVTMFFAILMFGEEGAEIIYPNPGFPIYESVIQYSGATPVPSQLLPP